MEEVFTFHNLVTFLSLSGLEIVLGIDNVIFLAIIVYHIPPAQRAKVRFFGISLAIALRIIMICGISWVMSLTKPIVCAAGIYFSGRSLLLLAGGVFLVLKSASEFRTMLTALSPKEAKLEELDKAKVNTNYFKAVIQIIFVDLVLSFDSVIVAVGMANKLYLIIPAIFVAMFVMLASAKTIGDFMYANPSIKVLGVGFVLLVGGVLCIEGFGVYVPKAYLYCAMFFCLFIELINIRVRKLNSMKS